MFKVFLTDNIAAEAVKLLGGYPDIEVLQTGTLGKNELLRRISDVDAVIVRSPTKITKEVIAAAKRLKFIGRAGVGVDNIDVEEATARGIIVMNCPGGNTISTAEHTVAMILSLARRIPEADRSVRGGKWLRDSLKGAELYGKTLGVVGLGRVGREVARRLLVFSMKVIAHDPYIKGEVAASIGVELVDLNALLARSDFITIHVTLGAETKGMISDAEIAKMRDGVFIVNCARGGVVDEAALERALRSGKVAGVGLDVYSSEPPGTHPLFGHSRSVFTPHVGAATNEAQVRVAVEVAQNIADALTKGIVRDAVNAPGASGAQSTS